MTQCVWFNKHNSVKFKAQALTEICPLTKKPHSYEEIILDFTDDQNVQEFICACGFKINLNNGYYSRTYGMQNTETKEIIYGKLPVGALYLGDPNEYVWSERLRNSFRDTSISLERLCVGLDGLNVVCVTPGGHWSIDNRASNCTMPEDNEHRCWCRHGTFGEPLHVDKNGFTCQAGAGSIIIGDFHGFLHNNQIR